MEKSKRIHDLLWTALCGGIVPSLHNLANLYALGEGTPVGRDDEIAFALYERGADMNDVNSILTLASWYEEGRYIAKSDRLKSLKMYSKAASLKSSVGDYGMGGWPFR